jgi:hypothetical protein
MGIMGDLSVIEEMIDLWRSGRSNVKVRDILWCMLRQIGQEMEADTGGT